MYFVPCIDRMCDLSGLQEYLMGGGENHLLIKLFFLIQREAIRRGLEILQYEVPGGDTFMHEGFKRVHTTTPPFFDLYMQTLISFLLLHLRANNVLKFVAGK